jgi:hypothetical protein
MKLNSMDNIGRKTHIATQDWCLSEWKAFRSSVKDYYTLKDKAYSSGDYSLITEFRELKLELILKHK